MGGRSGVYYRRHGKYIRKIPLLPEEPKEAEPAEEPTPVLMPAPPEEPKEPPKEPEEHYHYFYDKMDPHDSFKYLGDGRHQVEWFKKNTNADELIGGLSRKEISAFQDWTAGHFMRAQQYKGWDAMSIEDRELTRIYDKILDQAVVRRGVTVVRRTDAQLVMGKGIKTATLEQLRALEGNIVTSKGSMSCGAAAQGLGIGDLGKRIEYKIKIPAGSVGAGMWVGDYRINGWGPEQREFMMNRDTTYQVGKTVHDTKRDVYVVELKFVGCEAHDYGKSGRR